MAVPKLRFPEFNNDWKKLPLGNIVKTNIIEVEKPTTDYIRLGIRSHCKGTFHQKVKIENILEADKMFIVPKDNLIVNITFAWEQAIAITNEEDEGKLVSGRFPTFAFRDGHLPSFYKFVIPNKRLKYDIGLASPGGAGRNKVLNKKDFLKIKLGTTEKREQQKIADFLTLFDKRIAAQQAIIDDLEKIKKGLLQKIFSREIRFKDENGQKFPEWNQKQLADISIFIKDGTHGSYSDCDNGIPFLSAKDIYDGKVHIPNDCRRISKEDYESIHKRYELKKNDILITIVGTVGRVALLRNIRSKFTFQRSVGIIRLQKTINPHYVICALNSPKFLTVLYSKINQSAQGGVYLGELSKLCIPIPSILEQRKIADLFGVIDEKIENQNNILSDLEQIKRGLLQQMFV